MQRLLHTVGLRRCWEDTLLPKFAKCNNFEWEARKKRTSTQTAMHMKEVVGLSWTPVALVQDCRFGAKMREDLSWERKKHETAAWRGRFWNAASSPFSMGSGGGPLLHRCGWMCEQCGCDVVQVLEQRASELWQWQRGLLELGQHLEFSHAGRSHEPHLLWVVHAHLLRLLFVSKGSI